MTAETLFSLASAAVLPGWALLVLVPRWKWTARLVGPVLIPALLSLLYLYLLAQRWAILAGGFGSPATVRRLFDDPAVLLAGWVHYLAFDLFVGSWEVRDAQRLALPHLLVVPCLLLTLLFGPVGLLSYLVLRGSLRRRLRIDEEL
ncbi:MAG TPA: ABA4-like family protein [Vicinamibacteria bacterium]|nr:ABA4-like family protein [Vicinamibacteria bacterium]